VRAVFLVIGATTLAIAIISAFVLPGDERSERFESEELVAAD
jgi:hypothetical protein